MSGPGAIASTTNITAPETGHWWEPAAEWLKGGALPMPGWLSPDEVSQVLRKLPKLPLQPEGPLPGGPLFVGNTLRVLGRLGLAGLSIGAAIALEPPPSRTTPGWLEMYPEDKPTPPEGPPAVPVRAIPPDINPDGTRATPRFIEFAPASAESDSSGQDAPRLQEGDRTATSVASAAAEVPDDDGAHEVDADLFGILAKVPLPNEKQALRELIGKVLSDSGDLQLLAGKLSALSKQLSSYWHRCLDEAGRATGDSWTLFSRAHWLAEHTSQLLDYLKNGSPALTDAGEAASADVTSDTMRALVSDYQALARRQLRWPSGDVRVERDRAEILRLGTAIEAEHIRLHANVTQAPDDIDLKAISNGQKAAAAQAPWPMVGAEIERMRSWVSTSHPTARDLKWLEEIKSQQESLGKDPDALTHFELTVLREQALRLLYSHRNEVDRWSNAKNFPGEHTVFPSAAARQELQYISPSNQRRLEELAKAQERLDAIRREVLDLTDRLSHADPTHHMDPAQKAKWKTVRGNEPMATTAINNVLLQSTDYRDISLRELVDRVGTAIRGTRRVPVDQDSIDANHALLEGTEAAGHSQLSKELKALLTPDSARHGRYIRDQKNIGRAFATVNEESEALADEMWALLKAHMRERQGMDPWILNALGFNEPLVNGVFVMLAHPASGPAEALGRAIARAELGQDAENLSSRQLKGRVESRLKEVARFFEMKLEYRISLDVELLTSPRRQ